MDLKEFADRATRLFDEQDRITKRQHEIAEELDQLAWASYQSGNSVKHMAQVFDVVPNAIYIRLKRYKDKNGDNGRLGESSTREVERGN